MRTVWKYALSVSSDPVIEMPAGARVLTVQMQDGWPFLWVEVDTEAPLERRTFCVRGTGHELESVGDYIGTFQAAQLVFHVYHGADQ